MSARMTVLFLCVFAAGFDMKRRVASGVVRSLPALTRDDVGAIPGRPIVLRRTRFVRAVAQFCLPKKLRHRRDVELHERTVHAFLLRSRLARKLIQHSKRILRGQSMSVYWTLVSVRRPIRRYRRYLRLMDSPSRLWFHTSRRTAHESERTRW